MFPILSRKGVVCEVGGSGLTRACKIEKSNFSMDDPEADSFPLGSFYVVVRVRPFNSKELAQADTRDVVSVVDAERLVFDPKPRHTAAHNPGAHRYRDTMFSYSHVFGTESTNRQIYEDTGRRLIRPALDGYNCSIFAYGATGAGKSHTMSGSDASGPGVIQNTLRDLYEEIAVRRAQNWQVSVYLSYFEIYNENVRDLLSTTPAKTLALQDRGSETIIVDLTEHQPDSSDHVLQIIHKASHARTQAATAENATSSRSHAILQLRIEQKSMDTQQELISKLSLIDLAGSERAKKTSATGERLIEGININKSLLVLGSCINALVQASNKRSNANIAAALQTTTYIPYRNSKLTRILKDSLGGASKTIMIANVSPAAYHFDDTYSTLMYASRAKAIKVNATRHIKSAVYSKAELANRVSMLTLENERLKKEVATLQAMIHQTTLPSRSDSKQDQLPQDEPEILGSTVLDSVSLHGLIKDFGAEVYKLIQEVNLNKQRLFDVKYQLAIAKVERAQCEKGVMKGPGSAGRLLKYNTKISDLNAKIHKLRDLLSHLDLQCKSRFRDVDALKAQIKEIPNTSLQEMLLDILKLSSMSLRVENLRTNESLLTTHISRMNTSINECREVINVAALRSVEDLYTMATLADEKMAQETWEAFNSKLNSILFLTSNYFEDIKGQETGPSAAIPEAANKKADAVIPIRAVGASLSTRQPTEEGTMGMSLGMSAHASTMDLTRRSIVDSQWASSQGTSSLKPVSELKSYKEEFADLYRAYSQCQTPQLGSSRARTPLSGRSERPYRRQGTRQVSFRDPPPRS